MNRAPFRRLCIVNAMIACIAYAVADQQPLIVLLALAAGAIALVTTGAGGRSAPRVVLNLLVLGATLLVLAELAAGREKAISTLSLYLSLILLIKMFDLGRVRDEGQLLALSVFVAIGATLTGQGLIEGALLALLTPLSITCAMLLQLHLGAESLEQRRASVLVLSGLSQPHPTQRAPFGGLRFSLVAAAAILFAVSVAAGVFIATPRNLLPGVGQWGSSRGDAVTGFTDRIRLGQQGVISQNQQAVMEVELRSGDGADVTLGETLYLRGAALDTYRGGVWQNHRRQPARPSGGRRGTPPGPPPPPDDGEAHAAGRTLEPNDPWEFSPVQPGMSVLRQRISMRATQPGIGPLFAVHRAVAISSERKTLVMLFRDDQTLHRRDGEAGRLVYEVTSVRDGLEDPPSADDGAADGTVADAVLLAVPDLPRLREAAGSILRQADVPVEPGARTPADNRRAARAIIDYLRANCTYTLEMDSPGENLDPIDMFLFETRRGHCEYFASAFALMMRSVGIPTRVITGFAAGEYNSVARRYTVRASDAHAWVEVRTRPDRWETFDPTPPAELEFSRRATGGILGWLRQLYEAIEFSWIDNVVTFDQRKQQGVSGAILGPEELSWIGSARQWLRDAVNSLWDSLPTTGIAAVASRVAVIGVFIAIGYAVYRLVRGTFRTLLARWFGHRRDGAAGPLITEQTRFYSRMLDLLAAAGPAFVKPDALPPLSHARSLSEGGWPEAGRAVRSLAHHYYSARFGGAVFSAADRAGIDQDLDQLRAALQQAALAAGPANVR